MHPRACETAPLQAARRANADQLPEQHAEVEAREVNQEALQDIAMPAQMRAPHPAGLVGVRERTLDALATSAHQALAAGAPNAPTIRIDGRLGLPRLGPIAAASIRLGDIRPDADGLQIHHDLITVIALVRDQRGERLGVVHLGLRIFDLVSGGDRRVANGRRIPRVCALHGHRDDRAGVEVHGMFDLVGQMRAAVFHSSGAGRACGGGNAAARSITPSSQSPSSRAPFPPSQSSDGDNDES